MPDSFGCDAASAAELLYTGGPNDVSTEHAVPLSYFRPCACKCGA